MANQVASSGHSVGVMLWNSIISQEHVLYVCMSGIYVACRKSFSLIYSYMCVGGGLD